MKRCKRLFPLLLAFSLLCMFPVTVYALETPDLTRTGSITVEMKYKRKAVTGGTLKAYRIGRVQEKDGNYSFVKTKAMEDFKPSYKNIEDIDLPGKAAAYVRRNKLKAYASVKNKNGKASFSDLELGLYLIVQTEASDGYEPLSPFLVSVPMYEDGRYTYKVSANGKFELEKEPNTGDGSNSGETEPGGDAPRPGDGSGSGETNPGGNAGRPGGGSGTGGTNPGGNAGRPGSSSKLPQTGQLNWPVPLLAVLGLVLFSIGWLLCLGEKRNSYAK